MTEERIEVEELLLKYALVDEVTLGRVKMKSLSTGKDIKEILIQDGLVSEDALLYAIGTELNMPFVVVSPDIIDHSLVKAFPQEVLEAYKFIPLIEIDDEVRIAVADPTDGELMKFLKESYPDKNISLSVAVSSNILETIEAVFSEERKPQRVASPAIAVFYSLLTEAVNKGASALYIEPVDNRLRIRYRHRDRVVLKGWYPEEFIPLILDKVRQTVNMADTSIKGNIKTTIGDRTVYIHARILSSENTQGAILLFRYPSRRVSLDSLVDNPEDLRLLRERLHAFRGCIVIVSSEYQLCSQLVTAMLGELKPDRRKVVAFVQEGVPIRAVETYIMDSLQTNAAIQALLDTSVDVVFIENLRRKGLDLSSVFHLAEQCLVITTMYMKTPASGMSFLKRAIDPLSTEMLLVVEAMKEPVSCTHCTEPGWQIGRGCRRCGFTGVQNYIQQIRIFPSGGGNDKH